MASGEFLLRLAVDATVMTMNRLTPPDVGAWDDYGWNGRDYCADDAQCFGRWGGDEGAGESVSSRGLELRASIDQIMDMIGAAAALIQY